MLCPGEWNEMAAQAQPGRSGRGRREGRLTWRVREGGWGMPKPPMCPGKPPLFLTQLSPGVGPRPPPGPSTLYRVSLLSQQP